jgi:mRNA interferase MazF
MSGKSTVVAMSMGDVWLANLDPVIGHEQGRTRPVLIVSANEFNQLPSGIIWTVPFTRTIRGIGTHLVLEPPAGGLTSKSAAMVDQLRAISRQRLIKRMGNVTAEFMEHVQSIVQRIMGL